MEKRKRHTHAGLLDFNMQSINGYFVDYASLKFMSDKHTVCQKSQ